MNTAMTKPVALMIALLSLGLAACETASTVAPAAVPAAPEAVAAPERTISYACDNGRPITVTLMGAERAALNVLGAATELRAVRTASGAKFESDDKTIVFWSRGREARVETLPGQSGKGTVLNCVIAE